MPKRTRADDAARVAEGAEIQTEMPAVEPVSGAAGAKDPRVPRVLKGTEKAAEGAQLPQKKYFRQRAHINPLGTSQTYQYPISCERMDWASHFPLYAAASKTGALVDGRYVEVADVGCGFGGLTVALGALLPESLCLGMEIRPKVTEYVRLRILALRRQAAAGASSSSSEAGSAAGSVPDYQNISVLKINAMKYLPNFFAKGQLTKLFFCFPDPQFKPSHHRRRIVNTQLLAEYAYVLRPGTGRLYTISDVKDLSNWMAAHSDAHQCFERIPEEELKDDPCVEAMRTQTEEGKKVERLGGQKHIAVFRRLTDAEIATKAAKFDFWVEPPVDYEYMPAPAQQKYVEDLARGRAKPETAWQIKQTQLKQVYERSKAAHDQQQQLEDAAAAEHAHAAPST